MSYHPKQFKDLIERMLMGFDPKLGSDRAVILLLGTSAQESKFGTYLMQHPTGPAIGPFQMESATFRWLQEKFGDEYPVIRQWYPREMEWNLKYAVVMARLRYRTEPSPLPEVTDIRGMAVYWDKYYNRNPNAGTPEEFMANWNKYVAGEI